jgi:hypothetical protein
MNIATGQLSRRTFLLTGTAFVTSLPSLRTYGAPLQVRAIGWGRHGRRFQAAVRARQLSIASVFDTNPSRARLAVDQQGLLQTIAPTYHCSLPSFVNACQRGCDDLPLLLCSPPSTWVPLLSALQSARQPVLVHHTECFDPAGVCDLQQVLDRFRERIFPLGLDPAWPRLSLGSFFDFARSRGAGKSLAQIEHPDWSRAQLAAFNFDFLDCAAADAQDLGSHSFRPFMWPNPVGTSVESPAVCRFRASGLGIELEAVMEVRSDISDPTEASESLEVFRAFVLSPVEQRRCAFERRRRLLEHALLTQSRL